MPIPVLLQASSIQVEVRFPTAVSITIAKPFDKDKQSQLLKGLNSVETKTQKSVCPGTEDGKFPKHYVDKLAAHILRIDPATAVRVSTAGRYNSIHQS